MHFKVLQRFEGFILVESRVIMATLRGPLVIIPSGSVGLLGMFFLFFFPTCQAFTYCMIRDFVRGGAPL